MPKMHQNTFGSRDQLGSLCAPPDPPAAMGTEGREGRRGVIPKNQGE